MTTGGIVPLPRPMGCRRRHSGDWPAPAVRCSTPRPHRGGAAVGGGVDRWRAL